jgi:hypothetical protein
MYGGLVQREGSVEELLERKDKTQITTNVLTDRAIEQIKRIVEKDGGEFEIKPPMQKLESFFIDIVRQAQQQRRPTSGAVNRIEATDAQRVAAVSDVLDRLVTAKIEPNKKIQQAEAETIKAGPDYDVLSKLAQQASQQITEPVEQKPPEENKPQSQDGIKKDLLNELIKPKGLPERLKKKDKNAQEKENE